MKLQLSALALALCLSPLALAEVKIADPWVRATVPAQKATGAFMTLTADKPTRLLAASTPAAEHEPEGDAPRPRVERDHRTLHVALGRRSHGRHNR